jgi:vitamin B12 transporter
MKKEAILLLLTLIPAFIGGTAAAGEKNGRPGNEEVYPLEETVVTATRTATPTREIASAVTVITGEEIEKSGKSDISDVLRSVIAIDIARTGGQGQPTSVFIRGAKSDQTLVLIDGVEANDPISTTRSFNFANLTTDNIERIEIIRGPQSVLYGSDAMGGVINIITKKGKGKPSVSLSAEGGSFDTSRETANLAGRTGKFNYSVSASRLDTNGISAASADDGNSEKDGYGNTTLSTKLGYEILKDMKLELAARYVKTLSDFDNKGGAGGDDPNAATDSRELFFKTELGLKLFDGFWEQKFGFAITDYDRNTDNPVDAAHPNDIQKSRFNSRLNRFNWLNVFAISDSNTLTVGFEQEEESGNSDSFFKSSFGPFTSVFDKKTQRTTAYFLQDQVRLMDALFSTLGFRVDDYGRFGKQTTWRATTAYVLDATGTKLKATYGTGFKIPSLFQRFSSFGNESLEPEKSTGWDAGIEQSFFSGRFSSGATYFRNNFTNLIDFDTASFKYKNVGEAETSGWELFLSARPFESLTLTANYTRTDTKDNATGEELLRRARDKFNLSAGYGFDGGGNINVSVVHTGSRFDNDFSSFPAKRIKLDAYTVVDLSGSYKVTRRISFFGRVDNLFDEGYEEVKGYGTPGVSGYAGIRLNF